MDEKTKIVLSGICGMLSVFVGNYGTALLLACAFIFIDIITGLVKAKIQGNMNSRVGYQGFWRKVALLAALAFGICLDFLMNYIVEMGAVSFGNPCLIGRIIALYIAINECISICENLIACGVKLPKSIRTMIDKAEDDLSNKM